MILVPAESVMNDVCWYSFTSVLTHVNLAVKAKQTECQWIQSNKHAQAIGGPPAVVSELKERIVGVVSRSQRP